MNDLATAVRTHRGHKAWSVRRLAREAGVGASTIARIERGAPCSTSTLVGIARALGLAPATLLLPPGAATTTSDAQAS